jgi:cation transport regulator ChaB
MPFTVATAPKAVRDALPAAALKIWVAAHTAALKTYDGDESKAAATAWAAVKMKYKKTSGGEWVAKGVGSSGFVADVVGGVLKALGYGAEDTAVEPDGEPVAESEPEPVGKGEEAPVEITALVKKVDVKNRLVWGWASVIKLDGQPVIDLQGDVIDGQELRRAVHDYVKSLRHAKVMHEGEVVGEVVDSFVWLDDVQKAYSVDFGCEGWAVGMEMPATVVARVEAGELNAFSIAGTAARVELPDAT